MFVHGIDHSGGDIAADLNTRQTGTGALEAKSFQGGAACQRFAADVGDGGRYGQGTKGRTGVESPVAQLQQRFGKVGLQQSGTAGKGTAADLGDGIGDLNLGDGAVEGEGVFADRRQALGELYVIQRGASCEGVVCQRGDTFFDDYPPDLVPLVRQYGILDGSGAGYCEDTIVEGPESIGTAGTFIGQILDVMGVVEAVIHQSTAVTGHGLLGPASVPCGVVGVGYDALESGGIYSGRVAQEGDTGQGATAFEGIGGDGGDLTGDRHRGETEAVPEGVIADGLQRHGQTDLGERGTATEGAGAKRGDAFHHHDGPDLFVILCPGVGPIVMGAVRIVPHGAGAGDGQCTGVRVVDPDQILAAGAAIVSGAGKGDGHHDQDQTSGQKECQ